MQVAGLIVAAGRGTRAGGGVPKQYRPLGGRAVLTRSLAALLAEPRIALAQVVIHPEDRALYDRAVAALPADRLLPPVAGGDSRAASVRAGLAALAPHRPELVLIHDAARPCLSPAVTGRVLDALAVGAAAAFPALPVVDALWRAAAPGALTPVARAGLWRAQTPQGFRFEAIRAAHAAHRGPADDDVAVALAAGIAAEIVEGAEDNLKITTPGDFVRATRILETAMDVRTGTGFDVHRFGPGDHVVLCGLRIPHDRALTGHSDADVGLHALTDAILGALAEGDIGQWFPPSDPRWQGADSAQFLAAAMARVTARGLRLAHCDVTLICEAPRIGPHRDAMRARLAEITGIAADRIGVKATTSEGLGFTGRGEGIAAMAAATLVPA